MGDFYTLTLAFLLILGNDTAFYLDLVFYLPSLKRDFC